MSETPAVVEPIPIWERVSGDSNGPWLIRRRGTDEHGQLVLPYGRPNVPASLSGGKGFSIPIDWREEGEEVATEEVAPPCPECGKRADWPYEHDRECPSLLDATATPTPWRVGSKVGRTIYRGRGPDDLIGVMDTRADAELVVRCVNQFATLEHGVAIESLGAAYMRACRDASDRQNDKLSEEVIALQAQLAERERELETIHERQIPLRRDSTTDEAPPDVVLDVLLACFRAWEPAARVLGNVRAVDAERAIVTLRTSLSQHEAQIQTLKEALIAETRCEECHGTGSVTTEAGVEECTGCNGAGDFCRTEQGLSALHSIALTGGKETPDAR